MSRPGSNSGQRRRPASQPAAQGKPRAASQEHVARPGRQPAGGAPAEAAEAKVSPARRAACEILLLVEAERGHSDDLLHGRHTAAFSEADRNLTTALVMGVLRWQIALDARLITLLDRPDRELSAPVAVSLRLGAFQLLHMDRIPAHAALSESVELCRAFGEPHAAGMVNAVLRRLQAAPPPKRKLFELPEAFAERLGHPAWLAERWTRHFGREAARQICEADQTEPAPGGLFIPDPALPRLDDGSRLVAELTAAALPEAASGARVWDCCAAPGGKTMVLAQRLAGAAILATDSSQKRLDRMAARLRGSDVAERVEFCVADVRTEEQTAEYDLILCDVPCSGTGTLARNPEIRLRLEPQDLLRQAERQREILVAALRALAPGGRLVYSTCSLEPEENEAVVSGIGPEFRRVPVEPLLAAIPGLRPAATSLVREGALRTITGVHPCDGFFAAVLERPA